MVCPSCVRVGVSARMHVAVATARGGGGGPRHTQCLLHSALGTEYRGFGKHSALSALEFLCTELHCALSAAASAQHSARSALEILSTELHCALSAAQCTSQTP